MPPSPPAPLPQSTAALRPCLPELPVHPRQAGCAPAQRLSHCCRASPSQLLEEDGQRASSQPRSSPGLASLASYQLPSPQDRGWREAVLLVRVVEGLQTWWWGKGATAGEIPGKTVFLRCMSCIRTSNCKSHCKTAAVLQCCRNAEIRVPGNLAVKKRFCLQYQHCTRRA